MNDIDAALSFELCRPVEAHARLVMDWRNDPVTLANSFHREAKVWEGFWPEFRDGYFNGGVGPFFALLDGRRVGFIRFRPFDAPDDRRRCVDISINLAPEARGRGLGPAILRAVGAPARAAGIDAIYADVRPENRTSLRAFDAAGFRRLGPATVTIPDLDQRVEVERFVQPLVSPFGPADRVFVIAEAGSNWRMGTPKRDIAMAKTLIAVAAEAGADAVKFQTYRPETVYVGNAGSSDYLSAAGVTDDIRAIFADLAMPYEMVPELAAECARLGVAFMSTPFSPADFAAVDPHVAVHKLASYEISHIRLIELAARSGKPLILSTGASDEADIAWAVEHFRRHGGDRLALMQCTARYPAPMDSLNLRAIPWLRDRFGVTAGLSDHSRHPLHGPLAAVALGARVIEKHYTIDNRLPGPDHAFALTPEELGTMVRGIRAVEEALGDGVKTVLEAERELADYARRGVQALRPIARGEKLVEDDNIAILRPGKRRIGVHPRHLAELEGRPATRDIPAGDGIRPGDWATGDWAAGDRPPGDRPPGDGDV